MTTLDERIEAVLDAGPEAVKGLDAEILIELARRWVAREFERRHRPPRALAPARIEEPVTASVKQKMKELAAAIANEVRVEWTADLMEARFRMPDGSAQTWGNASTVEHMAAARHLESRATGDLKGAATHRRAANQLQQAHVRNLSELRRAIA